MRNIFNVILGFILFTELVFCSLFLDHPYILLTVVICDLILVGLNNLEYFKAKPLEAELESLRVVEYLGKFSVERYVDLDLFISDPNWKGVDIYGGCFNSPVEFNSLEEANDFIEKLKKGKIIHTV